MLEELSDVSDIESNEDFDEENEKNKEVKETEDAEIEEKKENAEISLDDAVTLSVDNEDQLDFEDEEDGECVVKENEEKQEQDKKDPKEDLEEGELTDDDEPKREDPESKPICRFYNRGSCTWGANCRFLHPGSTDKGNYSMFDNVRPPLVAAPPQPNGSTFPPLPHLAQHPLADRLGVPVPPLVVTRKEEPQPETAWERAFKQAKEKIKKSSKKKEEDADEFEDKKLYFTSGQDELEKENNYYSRYSSPARSPVSDKWKQDIDDKVRRSDRYSSEYIPPSESPASSYYPPLHHAMPRADYWAHRLGAVPYDECSLRTPQIPYADYYAASRRYMHPAAAAGYYPPRPGGIHPAAAAVAAANAHHAEYYEKKSKSKQYPSSISREVVIQKSDRSYKASSSPVYRSRKETSPRVERVIRGDEWSDPWMRSRSPGGKDRRQKHSSKSSYSSSSQSSRTSRSSSYSSGSHSGSRSSESKSRSSSKSSRSRERKKHPSQFRLSPSSRAQLPTSKRTTKPMSPVMTEKRPLPEKSLPGHPPLSHISTKTRVASPIASASSGLAMKSSSPVRSRSKNMPSYQTTSGKGSGLPPPTRRSKSSSSESSSESSSSDSGSETSDSSESSSESSPSPRGKSLRGSKHVTPTPPPEPTRAPPKTKSMDALKISGQKQQIKLTLKGSTATSKKGSGVMDKAHKDRTSPVASRKRQAPPSSSSASESNSEEETMRNGARSAGKKAPPPSRREELLKQLKAVEDAIARKRSKIA